MNESPYQGHKANSNIDRPNMINVIPIVLVYKKEDVNFLFGYCLVELSG